MQDTQSSAFERYWQTTGINFGVRAMQLALREVAEKAWNSAVEHSTDVADYHACDYDKPEMICAAREIAGSIIKLQSKAS
jgi:hypothetical protein